MKNATHAHNFYGFIPKSFVDEKIIRVGNLAENTFKINPLVDGIANSDKFRNNFWVVFPNLQKLQETKNLIFCLAGDKFDKSTIFNGIKVINFELG